MSFWSTYMRKVYIWKKDVSLVHQTAEVWASDVQIAPY